MIADERATWVVNCNEGHKTWSRIFDNVRYIIDCFFEGEPEVGCEIFYKIYYYYCKIINSEINITADDPNEFDSLEETQKYIEINFAELNKKYNKKYMEKINDSR